MLTIGSKVIGSERNRDASFAKLGVQTFRGVIPSASNEFSRNGDPGNGNRKYTSSPSI